ncbi:MAG: small, acid-soluble spore protein, alpha/beta type [Lachnospiraceae bacterium]|nr:small, acid-soluble spore protein, alpha/beta type [Lachnospiraceae bacterium]
MMKIINQKQWERKTPEQQENERLKFEITEELGLLEKVEELGWKGLTARETGRIGGRMNQKKKEKRNEE